MYYKERLNKDVGIMEKRWGQKSLIVLVAYINVYQHQKGSHLNIFCLIPSPPVGRNGEE